MNRSIYYPIYYTILIGEIFKALIALIIGPMFPYSSWILPTYFVVQAISAPIQGGKSDNICRKQTLLTTLFASAVAQIFLIFALYLKNWDALGPALLLIALLIQGRYSNIPTVARAALSDISEHKQLIFSFPISFVILPFSWMVSLYFLSVYTEIEIMKLTIPTCALILISEIFGYFIVWKKFVDKRDADTMKELRQSDPYVYKINQSRGIKRAFLHVQYEPFFIKFESLKTFQLIGKEPLLWVAFALHQIGFQSYFYYLLEMKIINHEPLIEKFGMCIGFLFGCLFKPVFMNSEKISISIGILICLLSLLIHEWYRSFLLLETMLGFGSGMVLVCFYLLNLLNQGAHDRGKIIGAADSIQGIGDVLGSAIFAVLYFVISFIVDNAKLSNKELLFSEKYFTIAAFVISLILFQYCFAKKKKFV